MPESKKVNLKAFSVIYDSESVSLCLRYRGITVHKLEYGDHQEADIDPENTFEHQVKKHGKLLIDAIERELLPESIISQAQQLEDNYVSKCPGDVWNQSQFWMSSACLLGTKEHIVQMEQAIRGTTITNEHPPEWYQSYINDEGI